MPLRAFPGVGGRLLLNATGTVSSVKEALRTFYTLTYPGVM